VSGSLEGRRAILTGAAGGVGTVVVADGGWTAL
jgi:hypothetical protein